MSDGTVVPLNRTEHLFWASEGYLGAITQPYLLRLDAPVDEALVRQALRELTSAYPRLRGVIEPTALKYRLRILPDDRAIDQLFQDAYRVVRGVDATDREALRAFHTDLLNEPLSLERGLPWRARFIPHAQTPALIFSLHHIIGDGRSLIQMLSAIVARLNGHAVKPCPLQSPSMVPAVTPLKWTGWLASIAAWWRNTRADADAKRGLQLVSLATHQSKRFTTSHIHYHELPFNQEQLRVVSKQMGTTVNNLVTAVLANAFLARQPDNPQAMAAIRISVDLRRYFPKEQQPEIGNFVASFTVRARHQPSLAEQVASVEKQVKDNLARYERREYALPLMLYECLPLMGRNLYSHLITRAKAKGALSDLSCHFSNLGSAEFINPPDATVRVTEFWPSTVSTALIIGMVILGGKLFLPVIYQNDETEWASIQGFLQTLEQQFQALTP